MVLLSASAPRSDLYDIVLLLHIGAVIVVMIVMGSTYAAAAPLSKLAPMDPWPPRSSRFFAPGPDISGRTLYLIPITGFLLLSASEARFSLATPFVGLGLSLWVLSAVVAEVLVFPSSAKIRHEVAASPEGPRTTEIQRSVTILRWSLDGVLLLVIIGALIMLIQP